MFKIFINSQYHSSVCQACFSSVFTATRTRIVLPNLSKYILLGIYLAKANAQVIFSGDWRQVRQALLCPTFLSCLLLGSLLFVVTISSMNCGRLQNFKGPSSPEQIKPLPENIPMLKTHFTFETLCSGSTLKLMRSM